MLLEEVDPFWRQLQPVNNDVALRTELHNAEPANRGERLILTTDCLLHDVDFQLDGSVSQIQRLHPAALKRIESV